jgi:phosphoribosylformylglycinamidine synthase
MGGVIENFENRMTMDFKEAGDVILLIGEQKNCIGSSEYLHKIKGVEFSPAPMFELDEEFNVQQFVASLISQKLIKSAHDISEGGLAVTLLEKGFNKNLGFEVKAETELRKDAFWFGEAQSRVVVTCSKDQIEKIKSSGSTVTQLGTVTNGEIKVNGESWGNITDWKQKYDTAIESMLNN